MPRQKYMKNSQKGSIIVWILIVVIVILAGYILWPKGNTVSINYIPTPTSQVTQSPTTTLNTFYSRTSTYLSNIRPSFSFKIPTGADVQQSDKGTSIDVNFRKEIPNGLIVVDPTFTGLQAGQTFSDPKNSCQNQIISGYSNSSVKFTNEKTFKIGSYQGYAADYSVDGAANSRIACVGNIFMQGYPVNNATVQAGFNTILNSLIFSN